MPAQHASVRCLSPQSYATERCMRHKIVNPTSLSISCCLTLPMFCASQELSVHLAHAVRYRLKRECFLPGAEEKQQAFRRAQRLPDPCPGRIQSASPAPQRQYCGLSRTQSQRHRRKWCMSYLLGSPDGFDSNIASPNRQGAHNRQSGLYGVEDSSKCRRHCKRSQKRSRF